MFVENVGQFDAAARFQARRGNTTIYLADDALWFTILEREGEGVKARRGVNLKLDFPGANPHSRLEPFDRLDTHVSYFVDSDPDNWYADVPVWSGVRYVDLYPGVDLEIAGEDGHWTWRLVCGADCQSALQNVRLRVDGADSLSMDDDYVCLATSLGDFALPLLQTVSADGTSLNPLSVQPEMEGAEIATSFTLPSSLPLSPQAADDLLYGTYLGGSESDYGTDIAIDGDGDAYIIGWTSSSDFPASTGAFSETLSGVDDAFVVKVHLAGDGTSDRVYATYIGGSAGDSAGGIVVDGDEDVYITGWSNDFFPDTDGSFHDCDGGGAYVAKLNDTGSDLLYSGCIIGFNAAAQDIALDSTGQVYVSGKTGDGFPVTSGAYQETYGGGSYDAFLAIVSTDGTTLTYATYLGGNDAECNGSASGCTLDLDGSDNVYLAGDTESPNFPTKNAYDSTCGTDGNCNPIGGYTDAFLVKLDPAGSGTDDLLYATFIGDSGGDVAAGVAVDGSGYAYLTGHTTPHEFPITSGAYDEDFNGGNADVFLLKLDPAGGGSSDLLYSTFLGGTSPGDKGRDIAVDENGYAYAVGTTNSSGFPTTFDGYDTSLGGTDDAFVVKLDPAGNGQADLLYATFLGGDSGTEIGYALTVDGSGNIYVTGETKSDDFPTSINPYDTTFNGGTLDTFVVRLPTARYHTYLPLTLRNYASSQ